MNVRKKCRVVSLIIIVAILCYALSYIVRDRGESCFVYDVPYTDVIRALSNLFKVDITNDNGEEVWGPDFLDPGNLYWVETQTNVPNKMVRFKVWYYQVGGEDYVFTVTKKGSMKTEISLDYVMYFFIKFQGLGWVEQSILKKIGENLEKNERGNGADP